MRHRPLLNPSVDRNQVVGVPCANRTFCLLVYTLSAITCCGCLICHLYSLDMYLMLSFHSLSLLQIEDWTYSPVDVFSMAQVPPPPSPPLKTGQRGPPWTHPLLLSFGFTLCASASGCFGMMLICIDHFQMSSRFHQTAQKGRFDPEAQTGWDRSGGVWTHFSCLLHAPVYCHRLKVSF